LSTNDEHTTQVICPSSFALSDIQPIVDSADQTVFDLKALLLYCEDQEEDVRYKALVSKSDQWYELSKGTQPHICDDISVFICEADVCDIEFEESNFMVQCAIYVKRDSHAFHAEAQYASSDLDRDCAIYRMRARKLANEQKLKKK
jgi:hypothetical protein